MRTNPTHYLLQPLRKLLTPLLSQEPSSQLIISTARQRWRLLAVTLITSVVEALSEGATLAVVFMAVEVLSSAEGSRFNWSTHPLQDIWPAAANWLNNLPATPLFISLLALAVLFLGVLQLPSALVVFPVLAWIWLAGDGSMVANVLGTVYLFAAGMADGLLKPYLLGRGVDTPMPIVLIGALGGMAAEGLIGLFVGAVMLSVGYKLLMSWVEHSVAEHEKLEASTLQSDP